MRMWVCLSIECCACWVMSTLLLSLLYVHGINYCYEDIIELRTHIFCGEFAGMATDFLQFLLHTSSFSLLARMLLQVTIACNDPATILFLATAGVSWHQTIPISSLEHASSFSAQYAPMQIGPSIYILGHLMESWSSHPRRRSSLSFSLLWSCFRAFWTLSSTPP